MAARNIRGPAAGIGEYAGAVDLLVVNAGIGAFGPMEDFDIEAFDRLFAVNVRGAFLTLQAFTPALRAADAGMAVVVSSDVSTRVFPGGPTAPRSTRYGP